MAEISLVNENMSYYSRDRRWTDNFDLPSGLKVLDIGCGQGVLGKYLKNKLSAHVTGIEIIPENCAVAEKSLDSVLSGDIEALDLTRFRSAFDAIVFSDSLEHLLNPETVLARVRTLLTPTGCVLISVPNVRNFRVSLPLLFLGRWEYQSEGLLDRTHLRFFTRSALFGVAKRCGYRVESIFWDLPLNSKVGILNVLTLGLFKDVLTSHYFLKLCPQDS